ncbi:MAG: cytochrome P450 [Anaerolineales bacterium]|nr:cytochrome P450 [Anaerolineales bacterium]
MRSKLHEELTRYFNGRTPTLEDAPNLVYTRMILDETLRLYPLLPCFHGMWLMTIRSVVTRS